MQTEELSWQAQTESDYTNSLEEQLLRNLKSSPEYRHALVEESIRSGLTAQIASMRSAEQWDYRTFADRLGKKVSWAYRLEDPNQTAPTIPTLLQVAEVFDVALYVRFVPFSTLLRRNSGLTSKSFSVPTFSAELPEMESREPGSTA